MSCRSTVVLPAFMVLLWSQSDGREQGNQHITSTKIYAIDCAENDRQMIGQFTTAQLEGIPNWESTKENPPLAASAAIALSQKAVADKVDAEWGGKLTYELTNLILQPIDGRDWVWIVRYRVEIKDANATVGRDWHVNVLVTMDGCVVPPTLLRESASQ